MITRDIAEKRILELQKIIQQHNYSYYVLNTPSISDFEFDSLMRELEDLEQIYPEFRSSDSPTQKVGSDLFLSSELLIENTSDKNTAKSQGNVASTGSLSKFERRQHKYPMLSLANTYSIEEIEDFVNRAKRILDCPFSYCCELKFDGAAICLSYKNGVLYRALTRGDGNIGDDVTENIKQIKNIPHKLLKNPGAPAFPEEFEIRGEIIMPYDSFDKLNLQRQEEELSLFANPRNAASGSLKLLDPKEVANRGLYCSLYHIPTDSLSGPTSANSLSNSPTDSTGTAPDLSSSTNALFPLTNSKPLASDLNFSTHNQAMEAAISWGLPVFDKRKICKDIEEIEEYINYWDEQRKFLPFATDGIVIKINELDCQKNLGYTAKSPRWAVAYKFKAEAALSQIKSIDYQVGRTGAITPVANLEPVQISGTIVKRATLNNEDQLRLLNIHIGDFVYVEKAGEIIPKITKVEASKRPQTATKALFPTHCPACGTKLAKEDEEQAKHFCPNEEHCPPQIRGKLLHFLSRKAMNVIAGEATIELLHEKGFVNKISDFYKLSIQDLLTLEGWKEKSAQRLLQSLDLSKSSTPFDRVLNGLGIRHIGENTAKVLARHFENIDNLKNAGKEELLQINEIGEILADSIVRWMRNPENILLLEQLKAAGLNMQISSKDSQVSLSNTLSGLSIVISGNFAIPREEMKALISQHGGKNSSSISSKTSYLICGSKAGSEKLKKAEQLGIKILDEEQFKHLLENNER